MSTHSRSRAPQIARASLLKLARGRDPLEVEDPLKRVREIAGVEGPTVLGDDELLALVLGRGSDGKSALSFAHGLLRVTGGLGLLAKMRPAGLTENAGLGLSQAAKLAAAFELGRRAERDSSRLRPQTPLTKERVVEWASPRFAGLDHEEVWVLSVDARSVMKSTWQVGRGGVHGCGLVARDILTPVVRDAASGFILVHNHPSGDPTPSREDIELTLSLSMAATTICVPLLDHIVIARGGARSFLDLGLLP